MTYLEKSEILEKWKKPVGGNKNVLLRRSVSGENIHFVAKRLLKLLFSDWLEEKPAQILVQYRQEHTQAAKESSTFLPKKGQTSRANKSSITFLSFVSCVMFLPSFAASRIN